MYINYMVISRKSTEKQAEDFILKGGSISDETQDKVEWTTICIRLPKKMLKEIDSIVKRKVGIKRTGWILQTIQSEIREEINSEIY
jgi:agmatine/peptidylarginine deiminase